MEAITSFRLLYRFSLIFALFPFIPEITNKQVLVISRRVVIQSRIIYVVFALVKAVIIVLDVQMNMMSRESVSTPAFRAANTLTVYLIAVSVYRSILHRRKLMCDWLNTINRVCFDIRADTRRLFRFDCCIITFSICFYLATNVPTLAALYSSGGFLKGWVAFIDAMAFMCWLALENIYLCQFLILANVARVGFMRINEILGEEDIKKEDATYLELTLRWLRTQHDVVTDYYQFLNSVFEVNLLLYISWSFVWVLFTCASVVLFDLNDLLTLLLWTAYHPLQIWPILYLCCSVSQEAHKSSVQLHQLIIDNQNPDVKEEIEIFSLQVQHRPSNFNVCGFFNLDFRLLHSMIAVVTTYIIALLQVPTNHGAQMNRNCTTLLVS